MSRQPRKGNLETETGQNQGKVKREDFVSISVCLLAFSFWMELTGERENPIQKGMIMSIIMRNGGREGEREKAD